MGLGVSACRLHVHARVVKSCGFPLWTTTPIAMSGGDALANRQWTDQRLVFQDTQYNAVQALYWANQRGKRSAPTPVQSGLDTPAETEQDKAQMEVEQEHQERDPDPSLLQPFTLQDQAALEITAAEIGVNIQDHNAVQQWLAAPVQNNRAVFDMMRAYHTKVIRPEYFSLVAQLEAGLRTLNNNIFSVRKELSWMAADNRQAQKHACGVQLLTTGWPQGMRPKDREYMLGWMIMQVPKIVEFLKERGNITDHNAHEVKIYLNIFSTDPVTVPAGGEFFSTVTLLTFKAFDLRTAFLERFGGGIGSPLYKDDNTPIHGHHIKVAPASPQWQRKLEAPLRVLLSYINSHADHHSQSKLTILWKTPTLLEPKQGDDFKEDIQAWARLFYYEEDGQFVGRLEVVKELMTIMESPPTETTTQEPNLWCEQWNKFMWGNQYELDQAEATAVLQAKASAGISGKGFQLGKGKRHWSNMAIHTYYYEPYPFNLTPISVEKIFFSWDEMCDKFRVPEQKVGNYAIATVQGKPPAPMVEELNSRCFRPQRPQLQRQRPHSQHLQLLPKSPAQARAEVRGAKPPRMPGPPSDGTAQQFQQTPFTEYPTP